MNDVNISISGGGLGRRNPSTDGVMGLVTTGVAVVGGLQLNTTYELNEIGDLEALLVTAAYDATNKTLIHHHVSEFFRMSPNGTLFLRVAAQTVTLTQLADVANTHAKQLLQDAGGKVNVIAISRNPATGYTPTLTGGLDGDVLTAIPKAQELAVSERTAHRPVFTFVEGRSFNGTASSATDLRTLGAELVAVVIGQDAAVAALDSLYAGYAAVGTLLGTISAAKVNECVAWVRKFPLTRAVDNKFVTAALSSGILVANYTDASINTLNDKGYIFPRDFEGLTGFYWNDSHTCTSADSDFAQIENVRTIQKAARRIRAKLLPDVASPLKVDPENGKLDSITCKYFEAQGDSSLDQMMEDAEIVGKRVYVNPNQNVLSTSKLSVKFRITPYGVAREIEGDLGFDNPFNN